MAAAVGVAVMASACSPTINEEDLRSYVGELRSYAAEGWLLAGQAKTGSVPGYFTWLHSGELETLVAELLKELQDQLTGSAISAQATRAKQIGEALSEELQEMHLHTNQRGVLGRLEPELKKQDGSAESLYEKLQ